MCFNYNNQLCDLNTILTEMYFVLLQLVVWLNPHDLNRNVLYTITTSYVT